jgi:hypothetical protein
MMPTVWNLRGAVICGLALGLLFTASPLFTVTLAGVAVLLAASGRGLAPAEHRRLMAVLACALAARFAYIGVVLVGGIPYLNDLSIGALRGDDAYYLGRAIRARDIAVGITEGKYDFFVVTDEYGRTSYLQLLTLFQVLFGPTPYGMRACNALLYVSGAVILFRMARRGFGEWPAFIGLIVLLFLPSLFVSSVSLLKEPAYFLTTAVVLWCANTMLRKPSIRKAMVALALGAVCLFVLEDLRRGALVLTAAGIAMAVIMLIAFANARRALAAAALAVVIVAAAWSQETVRARAVDAVTSAAKMHGGHVFTVGHAYKLLDEGFYMRPGTPAAWGIELTEAQALRFLVRAAVSFIVTPLPWEMASLSELAFFPEHVLWWLIVACVPIGCVAGWRRDRKATALFLGFALPTAAALAVTNGNVGTLLRLRGLVTPLLIWLAALGMLTLLEHALAGTRAVVLTPKEAR